MARTVLRGELLAQRRKAAGWTQAQLAAQLGAAGRLRVGQWERGLEQPQPRYIPRLAAALHLDAVERGALILGPVGVDKTHLASALGHLAVRGRASVAFHRADQLFRSLKAARLDATLPAEMRRLIRVDLLVLRLRRRRPPSSRPAGSARRAVGVRMAPRSRQRSPAGSRVGVPPPTKTVSTGVAASPRIRRARRSSRIAVSANPPARRRRRAR